LIRIQPSLFAFTAQRTLEICHLEGRIGPEGDVQVNKLWPIGLNDCAGLEVGEDLAIVRAVPMSSTISIPIEDPPNRGFTM
jgi:hypothetical protein